jgi:hypothetical protein
MKTFPITVSALALLSGILAQGSFRHAIVVMSTLLFIGVPLTLFLVLWLMIGLKRSGGIPSGWRKTSTISAMIGGGLILSFGTGSLIHHWEIRKVRQFVEATVPSLDEYYHKNGTYPSALEELGISSVPRVLRESSGYSSTKNTFRFEYWDAAGMMDGYGFDSSTREWIYFD